MKHFPILSALLAVVLFTSACMSIPGFGQQPTRELDPSAVAAAAEATVTAMAAAQQESQPGGVNTPTPSQSPITTIPANTSTVPAPGPTDTAAAQSADYWITYIRERKLAAVNSAGSVSLLTNTPGRDYLPSWSPDGRLLGFIRFDGTNLQQGVLHLLPAGSNTPFQVDPGNIYDYFTWLPDSRTLLATRGDPGNYTAVLIDTAAGSPVEIAGNITEHPELSPDGRHILILKNSGESCSGMGCSYPNDVYVYHLDTRQTDQLTADDAPKGKATWSPDGGLIAYRLVDEPGGVVNLIGADGRPVGASQPSPWWLAGWRVSPDGALLAYFNNSNPVGPEVYVRPGDSSEPRLVIQLDESDPARSTSIDTLRWRPDGSGLIFNSWTTVYSVDLDGSDLKAVPITLENIFFDVRPSVEAFTPPVEPTAPAEWNLCPGGLPSRLDVGRQASVSTDPPAPNNVREGPARTTKVIGQIQPGEKVEITAGPVCEDGLLWWEVVSLSSGLKGYTLEGDLEDYWLVPDK